MPVSSNGHGVCDFLPAIFSCSRNPPLHCWTRARAPCCSAAPAYVRPFLQSRRPTDDEVLFAPIVPGAPSERARAMDAVKATTVEWSREAARRFQGLFMHYFSSLSALPSLSVPSLSLSLSLSRCRGPRGIAKQPRGRRWNRTKEGERQQGGREGRREGGRAPFTTSRPPILATSQVVIRRGGNNIRAPAVSVCNDDGTPPTVGGWLVGGWLLGGLVGCI